MFSTMGTGQLHGLNLVVADNVREGLLLDGDALHNSSTTKNVILIEGIHRNYSAMRLSVKNGHHDLSHKTKGTAFPAISYGYSSDATHNDVALA